MVVKCSEMEAETEKSVVVKNERTGRRASARIQEKQRLEKERLVRRRVELLNKEGEGEEDDERRGSRKRTKRGADVEKGVILVEDEEDGDKALSKVLEERVEEGKKLKSKSQSKSKRKRNVNENVHINANVNEKIESDEKNVVVVGEKSEKSAYMKVKETLRLFNKHYLYFVQEELTRCHKEESEKKAPKKSKSKKSATPESNGKKKAKRPDLKAISKMLETNAVLYPEKRIGHLPGVDVGHRFYSRAEMVAIGFHSHWLNGIDYMGQSYSNGEQLQKYKDCELPLAVAIVLSGMYEDDLDKAEEIVYTGQGGHNLTGDKRQIKDQVLERGNLALKNCIQPCVPVRVIRGHECESSYSRKLYTYDGLYNVTEYWAEKGISGFTVFKYRLRRCEGQPRLTTSQVSFINGRVPQSVSEIRGLVCKDITGGQESVPIPATNLVDEPPVAPTGYMYRKSNVVAKNVKIPKDAVGCNCDGVCINPKTCSCAKLNGSDFPYVHLNGGRLIEARDVVFECGPNCGCGPDCVNRITQRGLRYRLEVFRTPMKGWGVRSWDFIPSGAPVCEYTGILRRTEDLDNVSENNYIFEIDCLQTMKEIGRRERRLRDVSIPTIHNLDIPDGQRSENVPEFCIDAGSTGNIARFINHSCEPNLFVQCVLSSHHDIKLAKVMLFAADNIPPLQELTYDYGYTLDSVHGPDGKIIEVPCYCGAEDCRRRLL